MYGRSFFLMFGAGLLGLLAIQKAPADPDLPDVPAPLKGVEVQARGPIHEAFAAPVDGQPQPSPVVPKAPPALVDETPPDQKPEGDNVQWIPGYWQWDDDRSDFTWISGFWRTPPPDRQWVPGHWDKTDDGWQWVSGYWAATTQDQVTYLPPPPATIDVGPSTPPPDENSLYVPGNWVYRETRYRWRPGYYVADQPDFVWIPAHYEWTPAGYVFVDGYWDYPLAQRGLLFAPVCFDPVVLQQPDFVYTPQYVVSCDFLPTALFVRPACRHYYFGDYFEDRYERRGFTPWMDYRIGRYARDPLFDYYRNAHADSGWERGMRRQYDDRRRGEGVLPPRTLVQQNRLLNDIAADRTGHGPSIQQVSVLAPLGRANSATPLERIPASAVAAQRRNADKFRELGTQVRQGQHDAVIAHKGPVQAGEPPHAVKVEMPQLTSAPTTRVQTPRPAPLPPASLPPTPPAPVHKNERTPAPRPVPAPPEHPNEVLPPLQSAPPPAPVHKAIAPPAPVHHKEVTPAPLPPLQVAPPPAPVHKEQTPAPRPVPAPPEHPNEVLPPLQSAPPPAPVHKVIAPPPPPPTPPAPVHHKEVTPAPPPPPPAPVHRDVAPPAPPPAPPVHHKEVAPPAPAPPPAPPQRIAPPPAPKPAPPAPPQKKK